MGSEGAAGLCAPVKLCQPRGPGVLHLMPHLSPLVCPLLSPRAQHIEPLGTFSLNDDLELILSLGGRGQVRLRKGWLPECPLMSSRHGHPATPPLPSGMGGSSPQKQPLLFFFFLRFYLFIHERHTKRGRDTGRERSRLHAGSLMWDSILGLQDHSLGQRQAPNR